MAQTERVLNYLEKNGSITSLEAFRELGITRLSACIFKLRQRGVAITSISEENTNRYGDRSRYARYRLVRGEK